MRTGLHYYKGMVGLAIQTVMGPVNLYENAFVCTILLHSAAALLPDAAVFDKNKLEELDADDEIVDGQANLVTVRGGAAATKAMAGSSNNSTGSGRKQSLKNSCWTPGTRASRRI